LLARHEFYRTVLAAETVALKHGAQVMLLSNLDLRSGGDSKLANGSRGTVTGFRSASSCRRKLRAMIAEARTHAHTHHALTSEQPS
jgi:hypothetical protein